MDSELNNAALGNNSTVASIVDTYSDQNDTKEKMGSMEPPAKSGFADPAKKRREKIKKLKARLQREEALDNAATRKERDGQLFVWGAMVEAVYRDGDAQERDRLRGWAKRKLTDKRHLQRAENGFARIEDEVEDSTES